MLLFLGDIRTTAVAVLVIPVTVLITLAAMRPLGLSFNLMTLGGIAAAIGLVIDDAIVMIEAIHTRRQQGLAPVEAVSRALAGTGRRRKPTASTTSAAGATATSTSTMRATCAFSRNALRMVRESTSSTS
jgi:multidrug efflux pump subunit AcrB